MPDALSDTTNLPTGQPDALAQALEDLAKTRADLENMKTVVSGLSKPSKRRKRKRDVSLPPAPDDAENEGPSTNKAKTSPPAHSQDFEKHGRIIMRFIGPFESIEEIISHGLKVDTTLLGDEVEETAEEKRLFESWKIVYQKFPGFHDLMLGIHQDLPLVQHIARQMNTGMEGARSDDSGNIKPRILAWTAENPTPGATTVTASTSKTARGWADPLTGELLLPLEYKDDPEHPNPLELIPAGDLDIHGKQLPCFLFPFGQPNDATALDTVLSGPIMLRSAKGIFMGPSSALQGDGWHAGKPGNAVIIGLKSFTGRIIAYIACQVRFNLSSQQSWNKKDGHFDYEEFFWYLVGLFDDKEFATRTIALYNRVVLGRAAGIKSAPQTASGSAPKLNHIERLKAARTAAAEAAAAEAAAAAAAVEAPTTTPASAPTV